MSSNGQARIGIRFAITNSPIIPTTTSASLLQSLYGAWNGDMTTNELSTSLYGVWNGEYSGTTSLETSLYGVWNGEALNTSLDTSIHRVYNGDNVNDTSSNAKNGTNVGGVTFTTGKVGNALTFNGSNYVTLPDNSLNSLTGDFSISTWVNFTTLSGAKDILSSFTSFDGNYYGFELYTNGTGLKFSTFNGTTTYLLNDLLSTGTTLSTNTWYNIVITRKASTGTKMYINGTLNNSNTSTQNPVYTTTNYATIGGSNFGASYVNLAASGTKIDALSIWQKELTESEVVSIYNGGSGAEYPFSSQTLASSNDAVGTNHGTLTNGATLTTGKIGKAFTFDGINDYISLGNDKFNFTGNFSFSGWVNFNSVSGTQCIFSNLSYNSSNISNGWLVLMRGQKLCLELYKNNGTYDQLASSTNLNMSTWYHITIVRVASQSTKIYINGVLDTSNTSTYDPTYLSTIPIPSSIGAWKYNATTISHVSNGKIEAINIWNKALTSNEVSMLYNGSNGTKYSSGSFGLTQSGLDSFGTNHGTLINTTYGTGKIGSAFNFNGSNTYVSMGTGAGNFGSNSFSISGWFYPNVGNVLQMLVAKGTTTATNKGFAVAIDNRYNSNQRALTFGLVGNNSNYQNLTTTTTNQYTIGNWNHFTVVWDSTNKSMKIYLNGVQATTTTTLINGTGASGISDISNTSAELLFGQYGDNTSKFNGKLDSVTMWDRIVSVDEVTQLYNSGTGAQYPFSGTFSSAINQLGVDNGTLMNGCYLSDGKIGKAFTFDGVNDFVQLPNDSLNLTGDFTISMWVNFLNLSATYQILLSSYKAGGTYGTGFAIYRSSGGDLQFEFKNFSNLNQYNIRGFIPQVNTWYHLTFVRKSSSYSNIYINGVLQIVGDYHPNDSVKTMNPTYQSGQIVQIGSHNSSLFSSIKIDSLTAYQKELTQAEVTELYNSGNGKQITATPIVQSGLVLNLDASRSSSYTGTGTTWTDISGNGYNGTMINGPIFGTTSSGSISFDGINDYVTVPYTIQTKFTNKLTLNAWVNPSWFDTGNGDGVNILSKCAPSLAAPFTLLGLSIGPDGSYGGSIGNGGARVLITSTNKLTLNNWVNICLTYDGSTIKLYKNGVQDPSTAVCSYTLGQNTVPITIASHQTLGNYYDWFRGNIGLIQMYNTGLSATEVLQNFNATKSRFGL
jgi:hypothetical protein